MTSVQRPIVETDRPELLKRLFKEQGGFGSYPLTPDEGAKVIAEQFLSDLPPERRALIQFLIEEWVMAWGDLAAEASRHRE